MGEKSQASVIEPRRATGLPFALPLHDHQRDASARRQSRGHARRLIAATGFQRKRLAEIEPGHGCVSGSVRPSNLLPGVSMVLHPAVGESVDGEGLGFTGQLHLFPVG